ncbi:ornithine cyclodeaminase [Thermoactinomyces mirandus]|uniref:Ornithine cyclodeaminase n=1 Tax=Thermoactinomyces mirandus TaxID=2756294 RepID=A0A7W1XSX3_9BACL|nr:ornithine cyclodeaminase [Thermoactinomyces mirandus]MBA4602683.1 ornithine cyclodeaminase [Thermoactinomyces mirandus]
MGIFDPFNKLFSNSSDRESDAYPVKLYSTIIKQSQYFNFVKRNIKFQQLSTIPLQIRSLPTWNSFFSVSRTNPRLIGFKTRSRRKFRHLYHNQDLLVASAAGTIEIITKRQVQQITLKGTLLEKLSPVASNYMGILLQNKERVAFINYSNNQAIMYEFQWQPFRFAIGDNFWLVGTRETYDGPGELYCFDDNGNLKWGISFKEKFSTMFGELSFIPYLLKVSTDSRDIFVSSMDRLYRLDNDGNLKARIVISELKEKELQQKQKELQRSLSLSPKTEKETISMFTKQLAAQFSMGLERMTLNSPFSGFTHDPKTDMLFILEEMGRVSAWDRGGMLKWINTFKDEGRYITWIDDKLVISFQSGETFWLNREGKLIYGTKLPKQVSTIQLIPDQEKYLIVCEDNRLYELHKDTGYLIRGSEGHPGMELFTLAGQNVFFDGGIHSQGYFWLAPENHQWKHFEAKTFTDTERTNIQSDVAPEITATEKFPKKWEINSKKGWFGSRVIDMKNQKVYAVEEGPRKSIDELVNLSEKQREKDRLSHNLVCYDLDGNIIWKKHIYSSMWSLFLSPDGEVIFTSLPSGEEITWLPGYIVTYSKDGQQLDQFKVDAHEFNLEFMSEDRGIVLFAAERGEKPVSGIFERDRKGKWNLKINEPDVENEEQNVFGAGLNDVELPNFHIKKIDKKIYELESPVNKTELKLSAAVYEAYESPEKKLVLRTGKRRILFYNKKLEKILELKEQENIQSVTLGHNSLVVVTKGEVKGYTYEGEVLWRYSPLPKAYESRTAWVPNKKIYVWIVSNNSETIVAAISEEGTILKSHSFDKNLYHRSILVDPEESCFVAQTNEVIQGYTI